MSEIITAYPTSGLTDRSLNSINTALFDYISSIPEVTEFFDSVTKIGDESGTTYSDFGIGLTKGNTYIKIAPSAGTGKYMVSISSYLSPATSATATIDIPVRHVTGMNGTTAIWLDEYSMEIGIIFGKFGDMYFLAVSNSSASFSFYYSDTGGSASGRANPFNGSNIGKGGDYIAQPYYHLGINTGDIYTFDGAAATIPYGKFKLGDAEFIRVFGNFALRLK